MTEATGWLARIFQHEIGHLNGELCIDRSVATIPKDDYLNKWAHVPIQEVFRTLPSKYWKH